MLTTIDLHSFLQRVNERIGLGNTIFVTHPTELRAFEGLTPTQLKDAASWYGLQIVRRLGGRQFEITRLAKT
ncbi:hypothetical protein N9C66_04840 [Akkermansiaceae bacterium]|nr:hypothetical protein [Akkermansiaceae bacterium]MDB4466120.1 hypothetical protein [bacterium]MDA7891287.1 hypothetical protein [Akkermansiaceae bacterium]MDA7908099.1 hypothetical protein [Akkermansiaceae bacterium]MDA7929376.1 hypothetical protein [Akkermansiaceae bacterium]